MAESFGSDPDRYDRSRPRYPGALVRRIAAAAPGPDVLDVGCGTGIAASQFRAAGCTVLGVDVDARMAGFARERGLPVEVGAFETWDPAGRTFDLVVAGQTWHWIDPAAGAAKAAEVLRPGGRVALFWNVYRPGPALADAFAAAHRAALPDAPRMPWKNSAIDAYGAIFDKVADGLRATGSFDDLDRWEVRWEQHYTRDAWLEHLSTSGEAALYTPEQQADLLARTGAVIDEMGGAFPMPYLAVAVTATRT
ncbi:methyltransferase domain-containing protein [Streptomyces sp. SID8379]|uniref:class I SAM-dependent methyltransferase n=2 Tax=unclassified Streptomyces TaxID=2593676 RepID=UPI0003AA4D20|nr:MULTISPECIES: class I SAM-dependent methyltransferase [unclassified Streptomyces]MYW63196.1 methyltransferase domain-containing protein [Streptomyces sp. SID8379]